MRTRGEGEEPSARADLVAASRFGPILIFCIQGGKKRSLVWRPRRSFQHRRKMRLVDSLKRMRFGEGERKDQEVSQQALHLGLGESGFFPSLN